MVEKEREKDNEEKEEREREHVGGGGGGRGGEGMSLLGSPTRKSLNEFLGLQPAVANHLIGESLS